MGKKKGAPLSLKEKIERDKERREREREEESSGRIDKNKLKVNCNSNWSGGSGTGTGTGTGTSGSSRGKSKNMKKSGQNKSGKVSSVTIKPKLASVHETSTEIDDGKNHGHGHGRGEESSQTKCLDQSQQQFPSDASTLDDNKSCPIYFGVRSYLHHFYETVNQHPNTPGTDEDFLYLIHPKGRRCGALWFKTGLIIGATLFLLGAIAIVIGYTIPRQEPIIGRNAEYEIVDKDAVRFNDNLDICKLIGLAGFCSGGLVLVISLLAPTFTNNYWDEDLTADQEPFRVSLSSSLNYESEPKSPIPVTEKHVSIQPNWD